MAFCTNCGEQLGTAAKFCAACGTKVTAARRRRAATTEDAPAAPVEFVAPQSAAPEAAVLPAAALEDRTVVERLLGASWRSAAWVALPTVVVAYVGGMGLASSQWLLKQGSTLEPVGFYSMTPRSTGDFFHAAAGNAAMAFGSPQFMHARLFKLEIGSAPLTLTLVILTAFLLLCRRALRDSTGLLFRLAEGARLALATALCLFGLSFAAHMTGRFSGERATWDVSPGRVLAWSLVAFVLIAATVAVRPLNLLDTGLVRLGRAAQADSWRAAGEGAVAACFALLILGSIEVIASGFAEAHRMAVSYGTVAKWLPYALGYLVNLSLWVFHLGIGGTIHYTVSKPASSVSLFNRHGLSAGYFGSFLLPVLAVATGALRIAYYRGALPAKTLSRACYRMTLPMVALYLVVAIPSRVRLVGTFDGDHASGHFGPEVLLGALMLIGWFLILGFAAGQLLRRFVRDTDEARRYSRRAWVLAPVPVLLIAVLIGGGLTIGAALEHGGPKGAVDAAAAASGNSDSASSDSSSNDSITGSGDSSGSASEDQEAQSTLRELATAEEVYDAENGYYSENTYDLDSYSEPSDVYVHISSADSTSFCATASGVDSDNYYTYDSSEGSVTFGDNC